MKIYLQPLLLALGLIFAPSSFSFTFYTKHVIKIYRNDYDSSSITLSTNKNFIHISPNSVPFNPVDMFRFKGKKASIVTINMVRGTSSDPVLHNNAFIEIDGTFIHNSPVKKGKIYFTWDTERSSPPFMFAYFIPEGSKIICKKGALNCSTPTTAGFALFIAPDGFMLFR